MPYSMATPNHINAVESIPRKKDLLTASTVVAEFRSASHNSNVGNVTNSRASSSTIRSPAIPTNIKPESANSKPAYRSGATNLAGTDCRESSVRQNPSPNAAQQIDNAKRSSEISAMESSASVEPVT